MGTGSKDALTGKGGLDTSEGDAAETDEGDPGTGADEGDAEPVEGDPEVVAATGADPVDRSPQADGGGPDLSPRPPEKTGEEGVRGGGLDPRTIC